ncbi:MAG: type II secretion system GspH family protein [Actinomycetota bacterium]|nr:type II secretion system GspH family protein [Actinomycetota bacterium]
MRFNRAETTQKGFTLIEVIVALSIFLITMVGVIPLLVGSVRGASLSRSYTVGKNVALEAMERARGFPYYVDFPTQKGYTANVAPFRKVDLLDLYFPNLTAPASNTGYSSALNTYTTTCVGSGSTNPACPRSLPAGFSLEYKARFVKAVKSTVGGVQQETYTTVPPSAGYRWDPPDPYTPLDVAPTQIVELVVTSKWNYSGAPRSFTLQSIIGEREFGKVTVRGVAKVDYGVKVSTTYTDSRLGLGGAKSQLSAVAGIAESRVETKTASTADQTARAGEMKLTEAPEDIPPPNDIEGAVTVLHAAPDTLPAGGSAGAVTLVHPDSAIGSVGGLEGTFTTNLKSSVSEELPTATGSFGYSAPVPPSGSERLFWVSGRLGELNAANLRLDNSTGLVTFRARGGTVPTLSGGTSATTTSVTNPATRKVETVAQAAFGRLRMLPILADGFSSVVDASGTATSERAAVFIDDFTATASCKSTRATTGGNAATASRSWSAKLYYLKDVTPGDNLAQARYQLLTLSSANGSDPLAAFSAAGTNPLVFDGPTPAQDVYLFEDPPSRLGYLRSWSSLIGETNPPPSGSGGVTQAATDGAIRVITTPVNPGAGTDDSSLSIQVGKLSCVSEDRR